MIECARLQGLAPVGIFMADIDVAPARAGAAVASSHTIFIDEAGHGANIADKNRFWVCSAVCIATPNRAFDEAVAEILGDHFHATTKKPNELKGTRVPKDLKAPSTSRDVCRDLSELLANVGANVWIAATEAGVRPPGNMRGFLKDGSPKEIARQLLFERVNGFLDSRPFARTTFQTIWDLSDQKDEADFSKSVMAFRNAVTGQPRNTRLADDVKGRLSHDVAGLQVADFLANYALHRIAMDYNVPVHSNEKAAHFDLYFRHRLRKDASGNLVGWKVWCPNRDR